MRSILRAILAFTLLLGSGIADWSPAPRAHDCCCGAVPEGLEDSCPCPKPESNRGPQRTTCTERQTVAATQATRREEQGQPRAEARPEPAEWASRHRVASTLNGSLEAAHGRDPDLGRQLARLGFFRI